MCSLERITEISVEDFFNLFPSRTKARRKQSIKINDNEISVSINYSKYVMIKEKGFNCVCCGIAANKIYVEIDNMKSAHVNFYHSSEDKEIMLTRDHIIPKSKGGTNLQSNIQPMCQICNQNKGNELQ
jgi:5-methylcytosine-specific restriction endonuclease McrA